MDISDPDCDSDNDGLTNHFEQLVGTNPTLADSDLDGLIDGFEATLGTDPMKMDTDLDGFTDGMEVHLGTNPLAGPVRPWPAAIAGRADPAGASGRPIVARRRSGRR